MCEPQDCKSALHPITHILARSTIDQTVINSHLSPTHCFPSCSMGLPPVPASTHGNSFHIKVCSWIWWARSKWTRTERDIHKNTQSHTLTVAHVPSDCDTLNYYRKELEKRHDFFWDNVQSPENLPFGRAAQSITQWLIKLGVWALNLDWALLTLCLACFIGLNLSLPYRRGRWQPRSRRVGDGRAGREDQAYRRGARRMGWSK